MKKIIFGLICILSLPAGVICCPSDYPIDCETGWCCSTGHPYYDEVGPASYKLFICNPGQQDDWCINTNTTTVSTSTTSTIQPTPSTTTPTTTILQGESRYYERNFAGYDGSGYATVDVTDKIIFKITVTDGDEYFCSTPESIVQAGKQYEIGQYGGYDVKIVWKNFDGCGDIYEGVTATGTMSTFPSTFNVWDSFRIYCGIWRYEDYFDIGAGTPPTTTTTSIMPTTSTTSSAVLTTTSSIASTTTTTNPCIIERIYGEHSEQTELLRTIRDNILSQTPEGREIVGLYYEWNPVIMKAIERDPDIGEGIKEIINAVLNESF